jgi:hypothetical protein
MGKDERNEGASQEALRGDDDSGVVGREHWPCRGVNRRGKHRPLVHYIWSVS